MEAVEAEARKWGNSLGVIIPRDTVESEDIKENEVVRFLIIRDCHKVLKETFGLAKRKIKKPIQHIKDELRAELYD